MWEATPIPAPPPDEDDLALLDDDVDFRRFLHQLEQEDPLHEDDMLLSGVIGDADHEQDVLMPSPVSRLVIGSATDPDSAPWSPEHSEKGDRTGDSRACTDPAVDSPSKQPKKKDLTEEERIQRTKERNRIYAARTRQRKSRQTQELRERCAALETENAALQLRVAELVQENARLRAADTQAQPCTSSAASGAHDRKFDAPATPERDVTPVPAATGTGATSADSASVGAAPVRAAVNKFRFTAAAATAVPPPRVLPAAAALTAAQIHALRSSAAPLQGKEGSPTPSAGFQSENQPPSCGPLHATEPAWLPPGEVPQPESASVRVDTAAHCKRSAETLGATLDSSVARKRRGVSLGGSARALSLPAAVAASVAMLCVLACLTAFAGSGLFALGPRMLPPSFEPSDSGDSALATVPHRTLTALPSSDLRETHFVDASMDSDEWLAAVAAIRRAMPAAEFVCTQSACVSLQDGSAAPPAPLHIAALDRSGSAIMLATIRDLAPAAIALRDDAMDGTPEPAATSLRGVGQIVPRTASRSCSHGRCASGFEALADSALHSAGLVAPGACRLVYDSSHDPNAAGPPARSWVAGRRAAAATEQHGAHGFVLLDDGSRLVAPRDSDAFDGGANAREGERGERRKRSDGAPEGGEHGVEAPVVSVMLPIERSVAEAEHMLTPVQHLYVVMVHPGQRFQAYECELGLPLYA